MTMVLTLVKLNPLLMEAGKLSAPNFSLVMSSLTKPRKSLIMKPLKMISTKRLVKMTSCPVKSGIHVKEKIANQRKPIPPEFPKIRKTVSGSLSENAQFEVAAGCSAYHSKVLEERSSRTAGC